MKQETILSAMFKGLIIALAVYAIAFIPHFNTIMKEEQKENSILELELNKASIIIDNYTDSKQETINSEEEIRSLKQELLEKNDIIFKQKATMEMMADQLGGRK